MDWVHSIVIPESGRVVDLPALKYLGGGGIGAVYEHPDDPETCIKIYKMETHAKGHAAKIRSMIANPPDNIFVTAANGSKVCQLAWPKRVISSSNGMFCGFTMPKLPMEGMWHLASVINPTNRTFDDVPNHVSLRLTIAANIASVLEGLHKVGHYVVDLQPKNILVYHWAPGTTEANAGFVALIDCDGFSIASASGRHYAPALLAEIACPAAIDPVTLSANAIRLQDSELQQDMWAFARTVFQLLNNGFPPTSSKPRSTRVAAPSSDTERILGMPRYYAFGEKANADFEAPAQSRHAQFSPALLQMFERTFTGKGRPATLSEWIGVINSLLQPQQRCKVDEEHWMLGAECGECAVAQTKTVPPTQLPPPSAAQKPSAGRPKPRIPPPLPISRSRRSPRAKQPPPTLPPLSGPAPPVGTSPGTSNKTTRNDSLGWIFAAAMFVIVGAGTLNAPKTESAAPTDISAPSPKPAEVKTPKTIYSVGLYGVPVYEGPDEGSTSLPSLEPGAEMSSSSMVMIGDKRWVHLDPPLSGYVVAEALNLVGFEPTSPTYPTSFECNRVASEAALMVCTDHQLAALDIERSELEARSKLQRSLRGLLLDADSRERSWPEVLTECKVDRACIVSLLESQISELRALSEDPYYAFVYSEPGVQIAVANKFAEQRSENLALEVRETSDQALWYERYQLIHRVSDFIFFPERSGRLDLLVERQWIENAPRFWQMLSARLARSENVRIEFSAISNAGSTWGEQFVALAFNQLSFVVDAVSIAPPDEHDRFRFPEHGSLSGTEFVVVRISKMEPNPDLFSSIEAPPDQINSGQPSSTPARQPTCLDGSSFALNVSAKEEETRWKRIRRKVMRGTKIVGNATLVSARCYFGKGNKLDCDSERAPSDVEKAVRLFFEDRAYNSKQDRAGQCVDFSFVIPESR
jgi:uncharacterized protein